MEEKELIIKITNLEHDVSELNKRVDELGKITKAFYNLASDVKVMVTEMSYMKQDIKDIKDEEMMAAALVATIDYHNETKKDVRVVSIKEIK
mgnify:CR=1 FL=1